MSSHPLSHHFPKFSEGGGRCAFIWDLVCTKPGITLSPNRGTRLFVLLILIYCLLVPGNTHLRAPSLQMTIGWRGTDWVGWENFQKPPHSLRRPRSHWVTSSISRDSKETDAMHDCKKKFKTHFSASTHIKSSLMCTIGVWCMHSGRKYLNECTPVNHDPLLHLLSGRGSANRRQT